MKRVLITFTLLLMFALPAALAGTDTVTVHGTVGMLQANLIHEKYPDQVIGAVNLWNTHDNFIIEVFPIEPYLIRQAFIYLSDQPAPELPPELLELMAEYEALLRDDPDNLQLQEQYETMMQAYEQEMLGPNFGQWAFDVKYRKDYVDHYRLEVPLKDMEYLQWGLFGKPWVAERIVNFAIRVQLKTDDAVPVTFHAWAVNPHYATYTQRTAWSLNSYAFEYELQKPKVGQFIGPVHGLTYATPTHYGTTGEDEGGFGFYPGEDISFWIGPAYIGTGVAINQVSPMELRPMKDVEDVEVVNMARLLLSLDDSEDITGAIEISPDVASTLPAGPIDFENTDQINLLVEAQLLPASVEDAQAWLEKTIGSKLMRRNVSKSPDYKVDKPKLDIMPVWTPAKTANGLSTTVIYKDDEGNVIDERDKVKPLFITYSEEQEPHTEAGIVRRGSDIITAVSMDDGATWKRFNVSHMANKSSITLDSGEKFPGDSRAPRQKIVDNKILVAWESAYARGGKPSFSIKLDDDYPYDDQYVVNDIWGVRGRQGSVDYDEDKDVGDQGIGEIPYYAVWTARGVLVTQAEHDAGKFMDSEIGEVVWFKPERLTSGRRDAFFTQLAGTKNVGFALAWQEDPGGLLPGSEKGGGDGWSGATVHKKTDIWYSFLNIADFDTVDENFVAAEHSNDEFGGDEHGQQPEISNRPKWLVPMSLAVRVSDNNTVNTENLKVELDPDTGLPLPGYAILDGAIEEDFLSSEHETEGSCDDSEDPDSDHGGNNGAGGGWGMARYAYEIPELGIVDITLPSTATIWDQEVDGDYRPDPDIRWTRFVNKAGMVKTIAVTEDGRPLDGDTGACRPMLNLQSGGWAILGYEETKGLGIPPEGEHGELEEEERPEPDDKGKNVIYHSFPFTQPDLVSAGNVLNLPALDDEENLIPIFYKDALGESTGIFRQYKTEVARRVRFIAQPSSKKGASRTVLVAVYKQGREGNGKPADIFAIRAVVPETDTKYDNPYRFDNLERFDTTVANPDDNGYNKYQRKHMNVSSATVELMDPYETASDNEGNTWNKVAKWNQYQGDLSDESFANPFSDAKGHRGFLRGDTFVLAYEFTPNWGRLGGDHTDFYVRRSYDGGKNFTTDPSELAPDETIHTVIERDPFTGEYSEKQFSVGRGEFEPGRNVSLLKGNKYTVVDPRLVPPMGAGSTVNPTYPEDDTENIDVFSVAFGTAEVLHGLGTMGVVETVKEDIFYTRTTDGGSTWYMVPWVINPDSSSPDAGETVYRFDWLAQGDPEQGHAQIRTHPSGTRLYGIWHQSMDVDEAQSPNELGDDIWFRRIDFME